ncbi:sensor histidine kinase [Raineyella fluvialis]|uniref:histidine kinase n=1 Tax=Raineyella fluvialis TaxID=2662261 RepID=A0A5Q2FA99_9ACTN|nr:HAMP domain-containing sensor histidine kinase [Raineyella fluvialis]QGF23842.1 HAMP domain-containing protein [Raineyella fluvialis]
MSAVREPGPVGDATDAGGRHAAEGHAAEGRASEGPGVRGQAAVVAVLVLAFALFTGGGIMLGALGASLRRGVEDIQRARLAQAVAIITENGIPALETAEVQYLGVGGALQVIDPTRTGPDAVVFAADGRWDEPVTTAAPAPGVTVVDRHARAPQGGSSLLAVAQGVRSGGAAYVVVTAGPLVGVERALRQDALSLVVGVPLLSLLGGWAVWLLVGRTLRPVEELRSAVEEIGAADVTGRVPVPPRHDEIGRLAVTMNALLTRIQHSRDSQRRFVADASHELRSPVAALGAGLEILEHRPEELPAVLPLLVTETRHLASLTDGLLMLARADAGMLRRRSIDVDLDDILAAEVVRLRASGRLLVEAHLAAGRVVGEPDDLFRAVRNLVDNAARASRGRIGLSVVVEGADVVVRVDDDGPGIPVTERTRIFDRFVRLDSDRARSNGGAGLGLAIVHSVISSHGGTVTAGESPWGGARFEIRLPSTGTPVVAEEDESGGLDDNDQQDGTGGPDRPQPPSR